MKTVLIGAQGTIGQHVKRLLESENHEVLTVGKIRGDFQVNIEDRSSIVSLFKRLGPFDALVNASGNVAFAPLSNLTTEKWNMSLQSKLMGQINLVQEGIRYLRDNGSITLVSGIIGEEFIASGIVAATVNGALEHFVRGASLELPRGIRINIVSPTWLSDSAYGSYFPGFLPVDGRLVAQAYKKSICGIQTGKIIKVH